MLNAIVSDAGADKKSMIEHFHFANLSHRIVREFLAAQVNIGESVQVRQ